MYKEVFYMTIRAVHLECIVLPHSLGASTVTPLFIGTAVHVAEKEQWFEQKPMYLQHYIEQCNCRIKGSACSLSSTGQCTRGLNMAVPHSKLIWLDQLAEQCIYLNNGSAGRVHGRCIFVCVGRT